MEEISPVIHYDEIALRRIDAIDFKNQLRTIIKYYGEYDNIPNISKELYKFSGFFGRLYDSSFNECGENLNDKLKQKIECFLSEQYGNNFERMIPSDMIELAIEAIEIHNMYEEVLLKANLGRFVK